VFIFYLGAACRLQGNGSMFLFYLSPVAVTRALRDERGFGFVNNNSKVLLQLLKINTRTLLACD